MNAPRPRTTTDLTTRPHRTGRARTDRARTDGADTGGPGTGRGSTGDGGRPGRTLAVLDVENLLTCPPAEATEDDYAHAVARFAAAAGLRRTDMLVIGHAPRGEAAFGSHWAWPGARLVTRSGPDGADRALGDVLADVETILRGHRRVVIGSGDHHFIASVRALTEAGLHTTVVSWPRRLSRDLLLVTPEVRLLTDRPSQYALAA